VLSPGHRRSRKARQAERKHSFVLLKKGEVMDKLENKPENNPTPLNDAQLPPGGQPQPPEEPIDLRKLFPEAQQDLDALFPDPNTKKLLKEIVENRKRNERFVKKVNIEVATEKEESE
jgi:hypothetical protein